MEELKSILNEDWLNNLLYKGGVIAFVTDTVWGLGCLPSSKEGVNKIYEIKNRDRSKPLILMSNKAEYLMPYIQSNSYVQEYAKKYFPGALTIVSKKSDITPDFITSGFDTVGIRVPDNKFFKYLCSKINGHVLATTSANISNEPAGKTYEEVKKTMEGLADFIFDDYGYKAEGIASTVVLLEKNGNYKILRRGIINFHQ